MNITPTKLVEKVLTAEAISAKKHALQSLDNLAEKRWVSRIQLVEFSFREFGESNLRNLNMGQIQKIRKAINEGELK